VDLAKSELITFSCNCPKFTRSKVLGLRYNNPAYGDSHIMAVDNLWFLGIYINRELDWQPHVNIMVNYIHSTIYRVNLLGNSVRGLDFLNWRRVYNTLVIPMLMYKAQV